MSTQSFTQNYRDRSNDTGFQFEFFCDKCGNGHRSTFKRNNLGLVASLARAAGSLFGGAAYRAARGAYHLKDALRGPQWDAAYREAIEECRPRFRQCTLCGRWVCPEVCWNHERNLCEACAPNLHEHAPRLQAERALEQARQQVQQADHLGGFDINAAPLAAPGAQGCSNCQAPLAAGSRFCPRCGAPAAAPAPDAPRFCRSCGASLTADARFCAGCGTAAG